MDAVLRLFGGSEPQHQGMPVNHQPQALFGGGGGGSQHSMPMEQKEDSLEEYIDEGPPQATEEDFAFFGDDSSDDDDMLDPGHQSDTLYNAHEAALLRLAKQARGLGLQQRPIVPWDSDSTQVYTKGDNYHGFTDIVDTEPPQDPNDSDYDPAADLVPESDSEMEGPDDDAGGNADESVYIDY